MLATTHPLLLRSGLGVSGAYCMLLEHQMTGNQNTYGASPGTVLIKVLFGQAFGTMCQTRAHEGCGGPLCVGPYCSGCCVEVVYHCPKQTCLRTADCFCMHLGWNLILISTV